MLPFARFLLEKREQLEISQAEMAKSLGISSGYLSAVERGARPLLPSLITCIENSYLTEEKERADFRWRVKISRSNLPIPTNASREAFEFFNLLEPNIAALSDFHWRELKELMLVLANKQKTLREANMKT